MKKYYFQHQVHMSFEEVAALYDMVVADGLYDTLFYNGGMLSATQWVDFISSKANWLVRVTHKTGTPAGMFWINGVQGNTAQGHFCTWKGWEDKVDVGRAAVEFLKANTTLESLYGCTPKPYRHAIKFIKAIGFVPIGELPGACYMDKKRIHVPGIISVLDFKREGA